MEDNYDVCLIPLQSSTDQVKQWLTVEQVYKKGVVLNCGELDLGFNVTPAQIVSKGVSVSRNQISDTFLPEPKERLKPSAREVLIAGLMQARAMYRWKRRNKDLRINDSLQVLLATAIRVSSMVMQEGQLVKRKAKQVEDDKLWLVLEKEGRLKANLSGELKRIVSESKRRWRDLRQMHRYLKHALETVLNDFVE